MKGSLKRYVIKRNAGIWGRDPGLDSVDCVCARVADFDYSNLKLNELATKRSITNDQLIKNCLKNGDILIEKSGGGEKSPVGRAVYYDSSAQAVCSNFIERLRFDKTKIDPKFALYLLYASYNEKRNLAFIKQTTGIQNLDVDQYLDSIFVPDVSIDGQLCIVEKLDHATEKIAKLISILSNELSMLGEYRQSLIARAVTKGLNHTGPMKDSGIPWIGKIPAHWKMGKLANVGKFLAGSAFPEAFQGERNNQVPFYKVADLSQSYDDWHMNDSANTITPQQVVQLKASIIPTDCIVYAKIGAAMLLNKRRVTVKNCCIDNNMTAFKPTGIHIDWAYFWLSFIDFGIFSFPATVPSLSEGRQGRIPILIPPQNEQEEIASFIKKKINSIHTISKNVSQTIDLLKEFRASLVSNILEEGLEFNRNLAVASTEVCDE